MSNFRIIKMILRPFFWDRDRTLQVRETEVKNGKE
jgi:hypothetical protein